MNKEANKSVVATADNVAGSLRSGRPNTAVPHFKRSPKILKKALSHLVLSALCLTLTSCEPRKPVAAWTPQQYTEHELTNKLESIVLPTAWFDQCPVDDVIYFLQVRMIELDQEVDPVRRGIDFHFTRTDPDTGLPQDSSTDGRFDLKYDNDILARNLTFSTKNVRALDLLIDIAQRARIDVYLTSHGIYMVREGGEPLPPDAEEIQVFRAIRMTTKAAHETE
jgi:hypothetical protein